MSVPAIESGPRQFDRAVSVLQELDDLERAKLSADGILADEVEQLVDAMQQLTRRLFPAHRS